MSTVLVIGVGNPFRGDDGAGIEAARILHGILPGDVEVIEHDGEPAALIDIWESSAIAYVIDAVRTDDAPGTVHRLEIDGQGEIVLPESPRRDSSHALGLGDAVELARALDRLPQRLVLLGIAGGSFALGDAVSQPVREAIDGLVGDVAREVIEMEAAG